MAVSMSLPGNSRSNNRTLRAETRMFVAEALTGMVLVLPFAADAGRLLGLACMPAEVARQGKLSQFMADHILGEEDRHVPPPVVHADGQPDHLRHDRR